MKVRNVYNGKPSLRQGGTLEYYNERTKTWHPITREEINYHLLVGEMVHWNPAQD